MRTARPPAWTAGPILWGWKSSLNLPRIFQYPLPPYNVYAILSVIFSLLVFPPVGIFLGYKAKEEIARTGERGIELAKVGIIAGWVLAALQVLLLLFWCGMVLMFIGTGVVGQ